MLLEVSVTDLGKGSDWKWSLAGFWDAANVLILDQGAFGNTRVFSVTETLLSFTFMTCTYLYVGYTLITNYFKSIRSHSYIFMGFASGSFLGFHMKEPRDSPSWLWQREKSNHFEV